MLVSYLSKGLAKRGRKQRKAAWPHTYPAFKPCDSDNPRPRYTVPYLETDYFVSGLTRRGREQRKASCPHTNLTFRPSDADGRPALTSPSMYLLFVNRTLRSRSSRVFSGALSTGLPLTSSSLRDKASIRTRRGDAVMAVPFPRCPTSVRFRMDPHTS